MATVQLDGTNATAGQSSQIIPVITTEVSDEHCNINFHSPTEKTKPDSGSVSNPTNDASGVIGAKSNARVRAVGRSGGVHAERRYHTTGVIEEIKVNLVFFQTKI